MNGPKSTRTVGLAPTSIAAATAAATVTTSAAASATTTEAATTTFSWRTLTRDINYDCATFDF
jgi:hypothetical protein